MYDNLYKKSYFFIIYEIVFKNENIFYNFSLQQLGLINIFIDKVNPKNKCNNKHFNDKVNSAKEIKNKKNEFNCIL